MTTLTLTTELEAVNIMLGTIQEDPVNSLTSTGVPEVAVAASILTERSRAVQKKGWTFNTEKRFPLIPDTDGHIDLPPGVLQVSFPYSRMCNTTPVARGSRVYDSKNRTYVFTATLQADVIHFLPFTELPEAVREYIAISAARVFQKRQVGSVTLDSFSQEDEFKALSDMKEAEGETGNHNLMDNYDVAIATWR